MWQWSLCGKTNPANPTTASLQKPSSRGASENAVDAQHTERTHEAGVVARHTSVFIDKSCAGELRNDDHVTEKLKDAYNKVHTGAHAVPTERREYATTHAPLSLLAAASGRDRHVRRVGRSTVSASAHSSGGRSNSCASNTCAHPPSPRGAWHRTFRGGASSPSS